MEVSRGSLALTKWVPIIVESTGMVGRAWEAVDAISEALHAQSYPTNSRPHPLWQDALLFGYLALCRNDSAWAYRAAERLNAAIDLAPGSRSYVGLFGGLSGLGWTVEHISHVLGAFEAGSDELGDDGQQDDCDLNEDIDAFIFARLQTEDWRDSYDLISGLVGLGVYFLERLPRESAVRGLQAILNHLERKAEDSDRGVTWHTPTELLPAWQREVAPAGYYNLGVAHGIPGIIYVLDQLASVEIEKERADRLLSGAVQWVLAQRRPLGSKSWFSGWLPASEPADSGLSWCYGDLGRVAILLQVSRRIGRTEWRQTALDLLDQCLNRSFEGGPVDAPLCHGAVGLAHLYNRLYQSERDLRCRDLALLWFNRALEMWSPGKGIGGYLAFFKADPKSEPSWESNPDFLDGSLGIALALLAALTPIEPGWDRMLLLSSRFVDSKA